MRALKYERGQVWLATNPDYPNLIFTYEILGVDDDGRAVAMRHIPGRSPDLHNRYAAVFGVNGIEIKADYDDVVSPYMLRNKSKAKRKWHKKAS